MKHVALLVHSCDRYEFLYKGFEYFFNTYWDFGINCKLYFATEELDTNIKNFTTIQSGKGAWADRLLVLLKNKIQEDYILYFQEDMWLNKKVSKNFFNALFELTIANHWQQVKLHSSDVYTTRETNYFIEGFNMAEIDNAASDYLMSHQVTLWNKDFLMNQLYKNEHPWRNERKGTKRLKKLNPVIYQADYFAENGQPSINQNVKGIIRSAYHTVSVNGMLGENILPYITELRQHHQQKYADALQYHFENKLTHDGKPKPRKEDVFKKIKKLLQNK